METVAVTGGAGFIGGHVVSRLLKEGCGVIVLDDLSTARGAPPPGRCEFHQVRLNTGVDLRFLDGLGIRAVLHLGGQSSGERSFEDPTLDLDSNVGGTLALLRWAKAAGVERFVLASTMGVYGEKTGAVKETAPCEPISYYGTSKLAAENYVRLFGRMGLPFTILRMFTVYGPGHDLRNRKKGMLGIYLSYLLEGTAIQVRGSLDRVRDFVFVEDVAEAWCRALRSPAAAGETLNLGYGKPESVGALIDRLAGAFGHGPGECPVQVLPRTPGDVTGFWADVHRLRSVLGWSPQVGLEDGIRRTMAGYAFPAARGAAA